MKNQVQNMEVEVDRKVDNLLTDPVKKASILQRLARLDAPQLVQ